MGDHVHLILLNDLISKERMGLYECDVCNTQLLIQNILFYFFLL